MDFIKAILQSVTRPARDLGELSNISKTAMNVKRAPIKILSEDSLKRIADAGLGSSEYRRATGMPTTGSTTKGTGYEALRNYLPAYSSVEEVQDLVQNPGMRTLKNAATVGSFAMPFGAANAATFAGRVGQQAAKGAIAGGLGGFGGSNQGEEQNAVITGALLGGVLGGATQGIGEGLAKIKPGATKGGRYKPKLDPKSKNPLQKQTEISEFADTVPGIGNKAKLANNEAAYQSTLDEMLGRNAEMAKMGKRLGTGEALTNTVDRLRSQGVQVSDDLISRMDEALMQTGGDPTKVGNFIAEQRNLLSNKIMDPTLMGEAGFRKELVGQLSDQMYWNKDLLQQAAKQREFTSAMTKTVNEGRNAYMPVVGSKVDFQEPLSKIQDILAGAKPQGLAAGANKLGDALQNPYLQKILGLGSVMGGQNMPEAEVQQEQPVSTGTTEGYVPEQGMDYMQALSVASQMFPQASETELITIAKYFMDNAGGGAKNATQTQAESDANNAVGTLESLSQSLSGRSGTMGPITGNLRGINPWDVEAQDIQAEINTARQIVGKFLEGGVLRKEDEEKYKKILPVMGDTPAVAQRKIENLIQEINRRIGTYRSTGYSGYGATTTTDTDLYNAGY